MENVDLVRGLIKSGKMAEFLDSNPYAKVDRSKLSDIYFYITRKHPK